MSLPSPLEDRLEIIELTHRYCWRSTRKISICSTPCSCPTQSPNCDRPLSRGEMRSVGIRAAITALDATQHTVTNHMVTIDGERATSRCYLHSQHIRAGRYEDELVRTRDGWRIAFRRLVGVWTDGNLDVVRKR